MIVAAQPESSARCPASLPIFMDLGCGTQSPLPSGTRSSVARVLIISWSNSASSASRMAIVPPVLRFRGLYYRTTAGGQRAGILRGDAEAAAGFDVPVSHARSVKGHGWDSVPV